MLHYAPCQIFIIPTFGLQFGVVMILKPFLILQNQIEHFIFLVSVLLYLSFCFSLHPNVLSFQISDLLSPVDSLFRSFPLPNFDQVEHGLLLVLDFPLHLLTTASIATLPKKSILRVVQLSLEFKIRHLQLFDFIL